MHHWIHLAQQILVAQRLTDEILGYGEDALFLLEARGRALQSLLANKTGPYFQVFEGLIDREVSEG